MVSLKGQDVGKHFQHEAGKHCCQRVPETESKGRRHTSLISVAVLPIRQEKYEALKEADLDITMMRGTGPGGQHRNTTESCVRIVHKPTGLKAVVDKRDQSVSKREALEILTARVHEHYKLENDAEYAEKKRAQMGGGNRGDKIRTYNFIDSRVTDHRTGKKTGNIKGVMKGNLSLILPEPSGS